MKHIGLSRVCLVAFFLQEEILLRNFKPGEVQASIIGGNPTTAASNMSVKNHLSRLGIFLKNPAIQCYRFLSRVDALFIQNFVPLLERSKSLSGKAFIPSMQSRLKQMLGSDL